MITTSHPSDQLGHRRIDVLTNVMTFLIVVDALLDSAAPCCGGGIDASDLHGLTGLDQRLSNAPYATRARQLPTGNPQSCR